MRLHQYPPARSPAGASRAMAFAEEDLSAAHEAGRQEGYKAGLAEGRAAGAAAAKARIKAILTCREAGGRSALARHVALETAMSPDAARAYLRQAPASLDSPIPTIEEREAGQPTMADGPIPPDASRSGGWDAVLAEVNRTVRDR